MRRWWKLNKSWATPLMSKPSILDNGSGSIAGRGAGQEAAILRPSVKISGSHLTVREYCAHGGNNAVEQSQRKEAGHPGCDLFSTQKGTKMMLLTRLRRWAVTVCLAGMGMAGVLLFPTEGRTDSGPGGYSVHHWEHKRDFSSWTFHVLLHGQKDLNLSADQVGRIEALALDYAKTRIRNQAAVDLAEVEVRALIRNQQSDLSAIEAALHKSESAKTIERLDRVKAIRTALVVLTPEQREAWRTRMHERHREGHRGATCENAPGPHGHPLKHDNAAGVAAPHETAFLSDSEAEGSTERLVAPTELP